MRSRVLPEQDWLVALGRNSRHAFTLFELLVVIAIIGLLVALLLPAIQAAREAARRSQCLNNLRQIGVALHLHHDAKGRFPPGHYCDKAGCGNNGGSESTWVTWLLPFLEQEALWDRIDWQHGFGHSPLYNAEIHANTPPVMLCPSSAAGRPSAFLDAYTRGSYAANNGTGPMRESDIYHAPVQRPAGVFYLNSWLNISRILDGTSNTAFVSELRLVDHSQDFRGVLHYPEGPLYHHNQTPNSLVPDQIRHAHCVNDPWAPCVGTFVAWIPRYMTMTARSYHPGGVNLLMGDGHVRFVSESVSLGVWQAAGTPVAAPNEMEVAF